MAPPTITGGKTRTKRPLDFADGKVSIGDRDTAALGTLSIALGCSAYVDSVTAASMALGYLASIEDNAAGSMAIGPTALAASSSLASIALGLAAKVDGASSVVIGATSSTTLTSNSVVVIGDTSSTSSDDTVCMGRTSTIGAKSPSSVLIGSLSNIEDSCDYAVLIGAQALIRDDNSIAIGQNTLVDSGSQYGIAVGSFATIQAGQVACVAIGVEAESDVARSVAVGYQALCTVYSPSLKLNNDLSGNDSVAIGTQATTWSNSSVAIGLNALVNSSSERSVVVGPNATTSSDNTVVVGSTIDVDVDAAGCVLIGTDSAITNNGFGPTSPTVVIGNTLTSVGYGACVLVGSYSSVGSHSMECVVIGDVLTVGGPGYVVCLGAGNTVLSQFVCAVGAFITTNAAQHTTAIGDNIDLAGSGNVVIGSHLTLEVTTLTANCVLMGNTCSVGQNDDGCVGIGSGVSVGDDSTCSVAIGSGASVGLSAPYSVALGWNASVSALTHGSQAYGGSAVATTSREVIFNAIDILNSPGIDLFHAVGTKTDAGLNHLDVVKFDEGTLINAHDSAMYLLYYNTAGNLVSNQVKVQVGTGVLYVPA
jgi:hypothetical protein